MGFGNTTVRGVAKSCEKYQNQPKRVPKGAKVDGVRMVFAFRRVAGNLVELYAPHWQRP